MQNQKLDNTLNLALNSTQEEREKSDLLNTGYDAQKRTWELIVRFTGDLEPLKDMGIQVYELLNGYAILEVEESLIGIISDFPQIQYIEQPKRLFFAVNQGKASSCINYVQTGTLNLSGRGVLAAVIDSGIDYYHEDFRNPDGSTRIIKLWDQVLDRVFTSEEINEAIETGSRERARTVVPSIDGSGHGTAVAGIAAGNGRERNSQYRGIAYESELLIVKLGVPDPEGFPRTTQLMKAIDFVIRQAVERNMPVAVNLSFGNTYGSHDGTSLVETFMDDISNVGKPVLVAGTGNEASSGGHVSGVLQMGRTEEVELSVAPYETGFSVQLWKYYTDIFTIAIMTPSGEVLGPISPYLGPQTINYKDTRILLYYGEPSPYSQAQEIFMEFIPRNLYIESGIWRFLLSPQKVVTGRYDMWLPSSVILNPSTHFLNATPDITLTIPSTAASAVSVGAYDDSFQSYADFSGRGYTRVTNLVKPDLAAPGVDIITASAGGGYGSFTGTSFAAPFVTGSAALMMEWGIVNGNDPYLYGEKVKAYLRRGARQLPGFEIWPNPLLGYGLLCLRDSLPV